MKLVLSAPGKLALVQNTHSSGPVPLGSRQLQVRYCGLCRTDAKMWQQGHRDLRLPRVLGHELVCQDQQGRAFVPWPGSACGQCAACRQGRENLCSSMRILGFHVDGGFAKTVVVAEENLLPVPPGMPLALACFAEPVGCVLNGLARLSLTTGMQVGIWGGGTMGLIVALVCRHYGAEPVIIEHNPHKAEKARPLLARLAVPCVAVGAAERYAVVVNACPSAEAFAQALQGVQKGGFLVFFSGLEKQARLAAEAINLLHYKECSLHGAYGLTRAQMAAALPLIAGVPEAFALLIEQTIAASEVAHCLDRMLEGGSYRYLLDWRKG